MRITIRIAVVLVLLLTATAVSAQTVPVPALTVPTGATLLSSGDADGYVGRLGDAPANAEVGAVLVLSGFKNFNLGSAAALGASCSQIAVYKVSSNGSQDLWQAPPTACNSAGEIVVRAEGTGHYIIYVVGSSSLPAIIRPGSA